MGRGVVLSSQTSARWQCPQCGYVASNDELPENLFFRPWHVRGRAQVKAYVETLGQEAREWLLALYVDKNLQLLAVDTVGRGDVSEVRVSFARILCRGHALNAAGFILVHNHPSGNPKPSKADIQITGRLRRASAELEMPMLDHLIIGGDQIESVGGL
jgi:DNA repair protein RadC